LDEAEHRPGTLKVALEEEDKPDEAVGKEVVEEDDDGAAEAVKEAEGVAVMEDSGNLLFCGTHSSFFCGTLFLWNILFCGTHSSCFCGTPFLC
jgi:hypothetical protein